MKGLAYVAAIVAGLAVLVPEAAAQSGLDAFPDSPANHWAYEGLSTMKKEGLLVGYPDGLFRGARPASRYEMAAGFHSVYTKLKNLADGIQTVIDSVHGADGKEDIAAIQSAISDLQAKIDALKGYAADIALLKRASDTFEVELEQLGVDFEAMKRGVGDLQGRVSRLEAKKPPVTISGDLDFWMGSGTSEDSLYGLNKDGRIVGTTSPGNVGLLNSPVPSPGGLLQDLTLLHEAAFTFSSEQNKGVSWAATVVDTDMFGRFGATTPTVAFGNQSDVFNTGYGSANVPVTGLLGYSAGVEDIYVQDASVRAGGPHANVELGRVEYQVSPYMFQRLDNTTYYSNPRWDNGNYIFDGAIFHFMGGPAQLDVFGGRNSGLTSAEGVELDPMRTGPINGPFSGGPNAASGTRIDIDESLGFNLKLGLGKVGGFNLAYIYLDSDTDTPIDPGSNANRLAVYGGDGHFRVGPIELLGGFHKSEIAENDHLVNATDDGAWNVRVETRPRWFSLFGEYREIQANYLAPGDWGRLGVLTNPTNIKGFRTGGSVDIGQKWKLTANGEFDSGLSSTYSSSTMLDPTTGIGRYDVRLEFKPSRSLSLYGEYEYTHFANLANPNGTFVGNADPLYQWTTFGLGYNLGARTSLNMQYEFSNVASDYQVTNGSDFRGGFLTTQVTVRF
jgi:hypothetical protein